MRKDIGGDSVKRLGVDGVLPFRFLLIETSLAHAVGGLRLEFALEKFLQWNPLVIVLQPLAPGANAQETLQII
jgi:hypothetical protein